MAVHRAMRSAFVVVACLAGFIGTLASHSPLVFSPSVSRYHTAGQQPVWGFRSRKQLSGRTGEAVRLARRPLATATAVAPTTSHLQTGRTVSGVAENILEGVMATSSSFLSGCILGGIVGLVAGATFSKVPDVSLLTSVKTKGGQFAGDWGKLTAAFTGFTQLSTIVRGRNDKWDQVFGACGAGAFLNMGKGPKAMLQGAASYGLFSLVFASQAPPDELDVVDVPVDPKKD